MDRKSALLIGMGFEIIGIVIVCVYVGNWLDSKFDWGGLGLVGMIVVGFTGWLIQLLAVVRDIDKNATPDTTKNPEEQ